MVNHVERMVLDLAVEDAVGPWEFLWRARKVLPSANEELVLETVLDMVQKGWLVVSLESPEVRVLDASESVAALKRDWVWSPPDPGEPEVRLIASDEGSRAYYALPSE